MSAVGYAQRLKNYNNKGICGLPETYDTKRSIDCKINTLLKLIQLSNYTVVLTGAGISTSCGIPDFRGPNGIWTIEQREKNQIKNRNKQQGQNGSNNKKRKRPNSSTNDVRTESEALGLTTTKGLIDDCTNDNNENSTNNDIAVQQQEQQQQQQQKANHIDQSNVTTKDELTTTNTTTTTTTTTTDANNDNNNTTIVDFTKAIPSLTHCALTYLVNNNTIQYVITQNIDGLHQRSGLSRNYLSVLHGCYFTEKCSTCNTEYFRDYDIGSISFQKTGRYCLICCPSTTTGSSNSTTHNIDTGTSTIRNDENTSSCNKADNNDNNNPSDSTSNMETSTTNETSNNNNNSNDIGCLYDTLLDWDDPLPENDYQRSIVHCKNAELIICIGTSLRIEPVGSLPLLCKTKQFIIINLQPTPYDEYATLIIRGNCNDILQQLMYQLGYTTLSDWYNPNSSSTTPIERTWNLTKSMLQIPGVVSDKSLSISSNGKSKKRTTTTSTKKLKKTKKKTTNTQQITKVAE